jgi:chromosome segregation ATPase
LKIELPNVQNDLSEQKKKRINSVQVDLEKNEELHSNLEQTLAEANKTIASLEDQKRNWQDNCVSLEQEIADTCSWMRSIVILRRKNTKIPVTHWRKVKV